MTTTETTIKMILDRWTASLKNADTIINSIPENNFQKEIAPGKNSGVYVLGHLIAVHDDMLILLGWGEKLYPELNAAFIKTPFNATSTYESIAVLKNNWVKQCELYNEKFASMTSTDWLAPHTAVSAEDFEKEPHRNKLNIILTRTTHLQYHLGQLILLK